MVRPAAYPVKTPASPPSFVPLAKIPRGEKHLDATLLAVVRRRKQETGVMPGVPFH
jgi:hypothetical protein